MAKSREEAKIQSQCYKWFTNNYCLKTHQKRGIMFSVPNELAGRNKISTILAKSTGLTSGVADTIVILPNSKILFVEFKTKKGRQSESQKEFEMRITNLNLDYFIIRSFEEFKNLINNYIDYK